MLMIPERAAPLLGSISTRLIFGQFANRKKKSKKRVWGPTYGVNHPWEAVPTFTHDIHDPAAMLAHVPVKRCLA